MPTDFPSVAENRSGVFRLGDVFHYGHNVGGEGKEEEHLHHTTTTTRFCTAKQYCQAEKETVDGGEISEEKVPYRGKNSKETR